MRNRLTRWRSLSWRHRVTLLACAVGLAMIHAALVLFGYRRTRRALEVVTGRTTSRPANPQEIADAQSLAYLSAIAGRHGAVEATCLRQSLLLYGWLRRRGLRPLLQIGVKAQPPPFQAHAWVELDGIRLREADDGFQPFRNTAT